MEADSITKIIRERRSVKPALMKPDPLSRETIELLLENARWAPTHGLTEPWHFSVFQGTSRHRLAEGLQQLYREQTAPDAFRPEKLAKLGKNPLLAPVVIALGLQRDASGKIPEVEEIAAVACAVQNMHLTAAALGLAGFWSSPPIVYSQAFCDFLGNERIDRCLGLFYLGFPQDDLQLISPRRPIAEKTVWH